MCWLISYFEIDMNNEDGGMFNAVLAGGETPARWLLDYRLRHPERMVALIFAMEITETEAADLQEQVFATGHDKPAMPY